MTTLSLEPKVLQWAAGNIGSTVELLAPKIASPKKAEQVAAGRMTAKQAEKFAAITRIPFGYLFLENPPKVERPGLPDLRQIHLAEPLSESFFDTLKDVLRKQEWYADHLDEVEAHYPTCVGRFDPKQANAKVVAADISKSIGCSGELRRQSANKEDYFAQLVKGVEAIGILVFKNGVVHNHPKRPLNVAEFRGFAIADKKAPLVFVNGKDSPSAWIFTLIHEVAHIWFGASGVSDVSASVYEKYDGIEKLCNQVAAEVLTPEDEFRQMWNAPWEAAIPHLVRAFKVSRLVVARRALDLGFVGKDVYLQVLKQTRAAEAKPEDDEGGGDFYRSLVVRNSKKFTKAIVSEAFAGRILLRDAGVLLNTSANSVAELYRRREG